jgi:thiamine-phosphate pyrophosphorylase
MLKQARLYLVTDDRLPEQELLSRLRQALEADARVVQFRAKNLERRAFLEQAQAVQRLCREYSALFVVNDAVDVAALCQADGVHLGQEDLPPGLARQVVGPDPLIGLSISALEEARLAAGDPSVDYLGVGALFATPTKPDAEYGGPRLLRSVRAEVDLPLVAIGGITLERAAVAWQHGADLIAVVSAVFGASDPAAATRALLASKPSDD